MSILFLSFKGIRKPFGELTNTPPSKRAHQDAPPSTSTNQTVTPTTVKQEPHSTPNQSGITPGGTSEALTPMANLKMLINVATAQASRAAAQGQPSRRELFKEENDENIDVENVENVENQIHPIATGSNHLPGGKLVIDDHDYSHDSGRFTLSQAPSSASSSTSSLNMSVNTPTAFSTPSGMGVAGKVSRKDKSLGLLCDKFISRFPAQVPPGERCEIPLDDLAKQMGTERRRIYDIVNVLEAIQMMTKVRLITLSYFFGAKILRNLSFFRIFWHEVLYTSVISRRV